MEKSESYLERLAALNRGPLKNVPDAVSSNQAGSEQEVMDLKRKMRRGREPKAPVEPSAGPAIVYKRNLPNGNVKPLPTAVYGPGIKLEDAISGIEVTMDRWGTAWLVTCNDNELERDGEKVRSLFLNRCADCSAPLMRHIERLCGVSVQPEEMLFMDLETTGLNNTPVFLVGLMTVRNNTLVCKQYFARDYSEEAAITAWFIQEAVNKKLLITFNGKSFDLPFLQVRAAANGVPFSTSFSHIDLLHEARRAWRRQLPDCKLQTLERWICSRFRQDDIPGSEVPQAYHDFVRTGDASQVARILQHNRIDLLTLAELLVKLPNDHWEHGSQPEPAGSS